MRLIKTSVAVVAVFLWSPSFAQNSVRIFTPPPTTCKTDQIHDSLMLHDAAYRKDREKTEKWIEDISQKMQFSKADEIYQIPLCVNVIHLGEAVGVGTNISLAQIQSAVDALNRDYRTLPDDGGIAQCGGPDIKIQFCLKQVNRASGTGVSGYSTSGITSSNESAVKAVSKCDQCCFYNIWVVSEIDNNGGGSGTQGYAYFPSSTCGSNALDGTVILYNAMGNDPGGAIGYNLKSYTNLGRVLTHEIGHALNLYHTFAGGSCTEADCTTQGDRCCDTPPHPGNNTNCSTPECAGTQPVLNYMDYTGESCQCQFTDCQRARMRAAIVGPRKGLITAPCGCPPLLATDAGITRILIPDTSGNSCGDTICPQVVLKDFGSDTLKTVTINYKIDATTYTYAWTGNIPPNYLDTITLPCKPVSTGAHTFTSWTSLPNGGADMNLSNDTAYSTFNTILGTVATLTLTTDNFGYETYWEITNCGATVLASGGNPIVPPGGKKVAGSGNTGALIGGKTYITNICLPDTCYCFKIYDDFGDGICCANGNGSYLLKDQFGNTLASGGTFAAVETKSFCVTSILPTPTISANKTNICAGDTIAFTGTSTGNPTFWSWTFPGGTPGTSASQNPTVVYSTAGTYSVTLSVTNSVGSNSQISSGFITVNPNPVPSITSTNVNCTCNGTATAASAVGTSPFTYLWNNSTSQTTATATGLCSGSYSVKVTDAKGCVGTKSVSILELSNYSVSVTKTNVSCNGAANGNASVTVSGGTAPYTYLWSNAATTSAISSLSPATYSVTVTSTDGCTSIQSITITQPALLSATATAKNSGCFRSCNGSATVTAAGGTIPYSYNWNDPGFQTGITAVSLCAGSYIVTVTDGNGCTATVGATITELAQIVLTTSSTNASCGNSDGTATVSAAGGKTPYTYLWNIVPSQTTTTITGLAAGAYTVMVTDSNGCSVFKTVAVNTGAGPVASINTFTNVNCYGSCTGSATVTLSGGASPFTYLWTDAKNQTTTTATGLCAKQYSVRVTDANNCKSIAIVTITEPPKLNIGITDSNNVSCNGLCNGTATVGASGGIGSLTYLWSNGQTTSSATGLCAGIYTVTVTDANSCSKTVSVTITQPPVLTAPTTNSVTPCPCPCAGVVRVFPAGGTPIYNVIWSNGSTNKFLSKLCDGTYSVTVTDSNGCTVTSTPITITNP